VIEFHPFALDELQAALSWYREKSAKAAVRFLRGVDEAVERVIADPSSYPAIGTRYRYIRIKKFPFVFAYEIRGSNNIFVVAIAHTSRRKGYWTGRA
jgi:plasmid stabilization system protein ParE